MSSLDEYQNLGKDLSGYVAAVRTNSGALGLQEAFKSGGKLFDVMQMLDKKEREIHNYEDQLLKAFDPENPGEITRDYVNKRAAENGVELAEIKLLKDRLSDLSSAVGQKTSGFAMTRAVNEFSEGIEKHEKVSKGFFSTFASFIGSVFKGKDEQKLVQASTSLDVRANAISNESQERFTIPGKGGKESQEIPQPEQVVQKGMSSQEIGEMPQPSEMPPPLPSSMSEVRSPIPSPLSEVGGDLPPPPLPSGLNVGDLPPPPPLPSGLNVGDIPPPPPLPSDLNVRDLPPPPPPMKDMPKMAPKKDTPPIEDMFDELRAKANKKKVSLNHKDYVHVTTKPKVEIPSGGLKGNLQAALQGIMGEQGSKELPIEQRLLDGASKKDQENILYSAMVDNNEKLVTDLLKHQSEFNTGEQRENEDGWEEDIIEKRSTFSPEQVETIRKAAEETKHRVVNGIELVTVKAEPKSVLITPKVEVSPTTIVKVESVLPIPPPPLKETVVNAPKIPALKPIVVPDRGGLLDQIRGGGVKLKAVSSTDQGSSLNSGEFTYKGSTSGPSNDMGLAQALKGRRGGIANSEDLDDAMAEKLDKLKDPKKQLNELYSAVIDGDKANIARIIEVGNPKVFTKENMEKIASAAQKISATQDISKKTIIEAGVKHLAKKAEININVSENRERG